jgi:hypothetical protein
MKKAMTIFFLLLIPIVVCAQQQTYRKSDAESEGLKGKVKKIVVEKTYITNGVEEDRWLSSVSNYDEKENLTQIERYSKGKLSSRNTYFDIDNYRAMKTEDFLPREGGGGGVGIGRSCTPDNRFTMKRKYEYDSKGNRIEESVYNNCNELTTKLIHKYDDNGFLIETKQAITFPGIKPRTSERKTIYKRDNKGSIVELIEEKIYSDSYSNYEFDERGNWIERKTKNLVTVTSKPNETLLVEYRTITYY